MQGRCFLYCVHTYPPFRHPASQNSTAQPVARLRGRATLQWWGVKRCRGAISPQLTGWPMHALPTVVSDHTWHPLPRGDQQHTKHACLVGQTDHDIAVWGHEAHGVAVAGDLWHGHSGAGQAEEEEGTHDVWSGLHGVRGVLCLWDVLGKADE